MLAITESRIIADAVESQGGGSWLVGKRSHFGQHQNDTNGTRSPLPHRSVMWKLGHERTWRDFAESVESDRAAKLARSVITYSTPSAHS